MISSIPIPQPAPACAARNAALVASSCARHDSCVSPSRVLSLHAYFFISGDICPAWRVHLRPDARVRGDGDGDEERVQAVALYQRRAPARSLGLVARVGVRDGGEAACLDSV